MQTPTRRRAARPGRPTSGRAAGSILDTAERLVQTRGYNGFSYADIAQQLGVTKASLHYHYASKAELGSALIARYHQAFAEALAGIDAAVTDACDKLRRYAALYESVMRNDRMCLCGMLAAEFTTLPAAMRKQLNKFFDINEVWLARALESGRKAGALHFSETAVERARLVIGALEGAMLVARTYGDAKRLHAAAGQVLADLCRGGNGVAQLRAKRSS